jgi:O-antigen/teichoic acid export membrane protein
MREDLPAWATEEPHAPRTDEHTVVRVEEDEGARAGEEGIVRAEQDEVAPAAEDGFVRAEEKEEDTSKSLEDLTEAAAGGLRWVAYARIIIEVGLFAAMVFIARLVPPSAFGIFAVIVLVQELALTMPMEGVGGALVQRKQVDREHLEAGFCLTILTSLMLAATSAVVAVLIVQPVFGHETMVLLLATTPYFLLGAIFAMPMAILRRGLDFRVMSILDVAQNTVRALATIVLAVIGLDASALVFGGMIGLAVGVVLGLWLAPVPLPRWHRQAARDLLPYGGPAALATLAWTGFRNGDYAIIGGVLGTTQAGLYWRAYQLAVEYQSKIAVTMTQIAFPVLSRSRDIEEMLSLRQRMVRLQTVVIFPLLAVLVLLAPAIIPWLFGPNWTEAVTPTQVLVLGGAATLVINAAGSALMAAGRAQALLGFGVGHFVVYAGAVVAVAHLGIVAVAIAGSIVHTIFLGVAYETMLRGLVKSPLRTLAGDLWPALAACLGLAALAVPVTLALESAGAPVTALVAGVGLAAAVGYLGALRLFFPSSSRDLGLALRRILPDRVLSVGRAWRRPALAG